MATEPQDQPPPPAWTPVYTFLLSVVAAIVYAGLVFFVLRLDGLHPVERTRLLIVVTLIIAMLGFGGLLITRALFTQETGEPFQNRFRLAREVFLAFSGIFGTIIGFYFGAQDTEATQPLIVEANWANGKVTASTTGGAGPFTGILASKDATGEVQTTDSRVLTFTMQPCKADSTVVVVDGRGHRAETTVKCETPDASNTAATQNAAATNESGGNTSTAVEANNTVG